MGNTSVGLNTVLVVRPRIRFGEALELGCAREEDASNVSGARAHCLLFASMLGRLWNMVRFPPPYEGPILQGRIDGIAYLLGWLATFAHLTLWVVVLALGLHSPWKTVSTLASVIATMLLLTIVIVIHRRMGQGDKLPRSVVWQWWLGPWDPVGRLVWLPVRIGEAIHVVVTG